MAKIGVISSSRKEVTMLESGPRKSRQIALKIETVLFEALIQRARMHDMTLSAYVRRILRDSMRRPETRPPGAP
jgi:hypothetical protein